MFAMQSPSFFKTQYGDIGGSLPWGNNSAAAGIASSNPAAIGAAYGQAYNNVLGMNMANYNNILSGFRQTLAENTAAQNAIQGGYTSLYNDVISEVRNRGQTRASDINRQYDALGAKGQQDLVNRGLVNSTVMSAWDKGVEGDRARELTANSESVSNDLATWMSRMGLESLSAGERGIDRRNRGAMSQLDFMNSLQAKYPNARDYGELAQNAAMQQAMRDRGGYGGGYGGGSFGGGAGPKLGYVPSGGPSYGAGGGYGSFGGGIGGSYNLLAGYGGGSGFDYGYMGTGAAPEPSLTDIATQASIAGATLPDDYFGGGYGSNSYGGGGDFGGTWGDYGGGGDF